MTARRSLRGERRPLSRAVGKRSLRGEWFSDRTDADHSRPQNPKAIVDREKVRAVLALVRTEGVDLGFHLVVIDGLSYLSSRREREPEDCQRPASISRCPAKRENPAEAEGLATIEAVLAVSSGSPRRRKARSPAGLSFIGERLALTFDPA